MKIDGRDILLQEQNQFYCKSMLLDFITKLKTNKKKLLLLELPEYGLKREEIQEFFKMVSVAPLDNIIIYTREYEVCKIIPQIFNYNVVNKGRTHGFDDYDELETQLKEMLINISPEEIQQKVMRYIFLLNDNLHVKDEFTEIVDAFLERY